MKCCLKCKYADVANGKRTIKINNTVMIIQQGTNCIRCNCPTTIQNMDLINEKCSAFKRKEDDK